MARAAIVLAAVPFMLLSSSCDKVPLLAPGGTVITLFPSASTVPLNGEIEIVATAIESGGTAAPSPSPTPAPTTPGTPTTPTSPTSTPTTGAGTPVHNGTVITFTTTIGRIEPSEARTNNGQVRVRFIAGGQSGTATVTAFSGGASARLENIRVGTAAVERVILTANPQTLGPLGGSSEITARVEDVNGFGLPSVPVSFTTTQGQFSANPVTTDGNGIARTTLTTTLEARVNVNVAGKTVGDAATGGIVITLTPRTGIRITPPDGTVNAGQPARFTVGVAAGGGNTPPPIIRDVTVAWGDGTSTSLGAISGDTVITHVYNEPGTFVVTATAIDANNNTDRVSTSVTILPAQPPTVTVTAAPSTAALNQNVRLSATVTGNTSAILRYEWNFDAGAIPATLVTTSNVVNVRYTTVGTKVISVTVTQASGPTGDGFGSVVVTTGGGGSAAAAPPAGKQP
jgi:Bacterial Ig-like domain (group 1)/PKD domain